MSIKSSVAGLVALAAVTVIFQPSTVVASPLSFQRNAWSGVAQVPARQPSWQVIGSGMDRRSVVLAIYGLSPCEQNYVEVTPTVTTKLVALSVGLGAMSATSCVPQANPLVAVKHSTFTVPLGRALRGQVIGGTGRIHRPFDLTAWSIFADREGSSSHSFASPHVLGLRASDAIHIYSELGVARKDIRLHGPRHGFVAGQSPGAAGFLKARSARVVLKLQRQIR